MIELRLHRDLYAGTAVDEAVKRLEPYARFELVEEPSYWVVKVHHDAPARARRVAAELGNHALGLTLRKRNAAPGSRP